LVVKFIVYGVWHSCVRRECEEE